MTQPKVSVILPVYNAGKYLHKCVQSLLAQTLQEIEIIVVLDCPTDGSDKVIREYAAKNERIKVIENSENLRAGLSRNAGMDAASGEYIGFCDHDDYVATDMFEQMYNTAVKTDANMVVCDINSVDSDGILRKQVKFPMNSSGEALKDVLLKAAVRMYTPKDTGYGKSIWNVLFRKTFLDENKLCFDDNKTITAEDCLLLSKAYFLTDKVVHCPSVAGLYFHVGYQGSTYTSYAWLNVRLVINYAYNLYDFYSDRSISKQHEKYLAEGTLRHLYTGFLRELKHKSKKEALSTIKLIRNDKTIHTILKPLWSFDGLKYTITNIPPTKLFFLIVVSSRR